MGEASVVHDIILVGTGNTATVLGRLCRAQGLRISQVCGRNPVAAAELAAELDAASAGSPADIGKGADLCLVAVSDAALYGIETWMPRLSMPVAHTAGSVPIDVLAPLGSDYGVLYPLQSLRKNQQDIPEIPFLVEGSNRSMEHLLRTLARNLSGKVSHAGGEERRRMHLAAVFTSNFFNHLCTLAEGFCRDEGIDFRMLLPLLEETVDRLTLESPGSLQTGPAVRGDQPTIDRHLEILRDRKEMLAIYTFMTSAIQEHYKSTGQ